MQYQGIVPPKETYDRHVNESLFDPGSKYHIPANTPYMRYFLAHILQFQFHKALCSASNFPGSIYECSINGSKAAGDRLKSMLALGASKGWRKALEEITSSKEKDMNASVILEYFAPLMEWLVDQNKQTGDTCGWEETWDVGWGTSDQHSEIMIEVVISLVGLVVVMLMIAVAIRFVQKRRRANNVPDDSETEMLSMEESREEQLQSKTA